MYEFLLIMYQYDGLERMWKKVVEVLSRNCLGVL
jgi:hypothetical protein